MGFWFFGVRNGRILLQKKQYKKQKPKIGKSLKGPGRAGFVEAVRHF
jgi:hypothetical protein